jgi:hypothetical protein
MTIVTTTLELRTQLFMLLCMDFPLIPLDYGLCITECFQHYSIMEVNLFKFSFPAIVIQ